MILLNCEKENYAHEEENPHHSAKDKDTFQFTFIRYSLSLLAIAVLVSLIYPIVTKRQVPCANSLSCEESLKLKVENNAVGIFNNQRIVVPNIAFGPNDTKAAILGAKSLELSEKHIYVNLKTQILTAYDGGELFMQTPISSGKWFPTPTGEFTIWVKLRSTRMSGGEEPIIIISRMSPMLCFILIVKYSPAQDLVYTVPIGIIILVTR